MPTNVTKDIVFVVFCYIFHFEIWNILTVEYAVTKYGIKNNPQQYY
ncbi:hypothetical protein bcere0026_22750 [Bacillus mycoides]|uniref:Uncharacterized protein n=1 Tax=Bacillus mycoides TaxID=1405 RepID=C2XUA4_BACMY|nr:hypothetical protein bcere0026_22750 [Bacillus mycoides]